KEKWKVNPATGTVAFGSAKDRWGFTVEIAQKKGVGFADIVKAYQAEDISPYVDLCPLHEGILNMFVDHLPPPHVAQKYRIPKIWKGDIESEIGQAMINCDENGPNVMCISDVKVDPQAGVVGTGRLFSGTIQAGNEVHLLNARKMERIQEVCIYMAQFREIVGSLPCGNIPALLGLNSVRAGETISATKDLIPFEEVHYVSEPVMTVAVEPKHPRDLPKLVDFMNKLTIEDPTLLTKIDQESGEYLISGMGQLHLEIATTWIEKTGLEIITGKPIVIYRESIRGSGGPFEGKSPNKHNRVFFSVEPLDEETVNLMRKGEIHEYTDRKKVAETLREHGWPTNEARGVWEIEPHFNILLDITRGAQYLNEVRDSIRSGFTWCIEEGPLARETMRGVKVKLVDVDLHEDPIHRGAAQIIPATRRTFFAGFLSANPGLLEPLQKITVKCPVEQVGQITRIVSSKRGKILSVDQKEYVTIVTGELPASETFDLSEVIRSATGGRAFWGLEFSRWDQVPASLQGQIITEIRKRKGLSPNPPRAQEFMER
ncbi:MAG: elongation factor EF-2, partial [Candidatus Bathyarchaeota archaeon]